MKVNVLMISGNHDSDDRLNYGSTLFSSNRIYISAVFDGKMHMRSFSEKEVTVDIYMLPFVKASQVRHFYPDAKIEDYEDAVRVIIENTAIDKTHRNILIAHQFVAGKGEVPALGGSESVGAQSVGMIERIGYDCFADFDYVALGHIHSPQSVGRDEVRYSGSPLKYSLSEVNNEKSVPLITVTDDEGVRIELVPLKHLRDLRRIRGRLNDIIDKRNVRDTEDFVYAVLTDEDIIDDAMGVLQQVYPNTVRIEYDNEHTRESERSDIGMNAENKTFSEIVKDFYRLMYGCDISTEEMAVMLDAAREAGIINEAG